MTKSTKLIELAVAVIISVILITLGIYQYHVSSEAVKSNTNATVDSSAEWNNADLAALSSTDRTGTEVLNAIRKYKSNYTVKVVTASSTSAGKTYNASSYVTNTKGSRDYINPESLFNCSLTMNSNGVITQINFNEKLQTAASDASITTPAQAKDYLVNNISGGLISRSDSWSDIAKKLNNTNDQSAKRVLATAVGGSTSDSWADLASDASTQIKDLRSEVTSQNANASMQHKKGSLSKGASVDLGFTPKTIIVVRGTINEMQMYSNAVWSVRNTGVKNEIPQWCTLIDTKLQNVNGPDNVTLQYEAFSY